MRIEYSRGGTPVASFGGKGDEVLCRIGFGRADGVDLVVPLTPADGGSWIETWRLEEPVSECHTGAVEWRGGRDLSLAWLRVEPGRGESFADACERAYFELLAFMRGHCHPQVLKVWHYLPGINQGEGEAERYRQFCAGRRRAMQRMSPELEPPPAATAIGIQNPGAPIVMYWLCGARSGVNLENPRQTSAWDYPPAYGSAPPAFSRATRVELGGAPALLLSGTASVVGYETAHPRDSQRQLDEAVRNLELLLRTAAGDTAWPSADAVFRVYLRNPGEWPELAARLNAARIDLDRVVPLAGDICRADLNVEIDGICRL